jgi:hypothetical protein
MENEAIAKISKILRTDKDNLLRIEKRLSAVTGKSKVFEKIVSENEGIISERLMKLGVPLDAKASHIYDAIISKIEADNHFVFESLGRPSLHNHKDYEKILDIILKVSGKKKGLFIKRERAIEFLKKEPPQKVMNFLGYKSVEEMLEKEDLLEIWSALRFVEGNEWLNNVFFKQYEKLKPSDFEEREIVVKVLSSRWNEVAEGFVKKKWHNVSHLKELGVIFVIPISVGVSGEVLRMISLIFHYLNEVPFYSEMFRKIMEIPEIFSENFISLLRGDVIERRIPEGEKSLWLVVQRYLAKDDENEWRLFVPHINPEALHWRKAEGNIKALGELLGNRERDLNFWSGTDFVGGYFKDEIGEESFLSLNFVDVVMSLVGKQSKIKYVYHEQEALWNKIFASYFSYDELEYFCKEYLIQGYFEI